MSYWPSSFYEEVKEHYSLHPNLAILWQPLTKIIWDLLYFHEKVLNNDRIVQRYQGFPFFPGPVLCKVWKSYFRPWWPGTTKQTCDQHWIMGRVQVSLFLWLIVAENIVNWLPVTKSIFDSNSVKEYSALNMSSGSFKF